MRITIFSLLAGALALGIPSAHASAAAAPAATPKPVTAPITQKPPGPAVYMNAVADSEKQSGLFTLYRKEGHLAMELSSDQMDHDYLEHVVPANGLGGFGFEPGDVFAQEARIVRFHDAGGNVAMIWPHTRFIATANTPLATAVRESTADSVETLLPVIARDPGNGKILVDMSPLLGDTLDLGNALSETVKNPENPMGGYRLDPSRTYFGPTKTFPKNIIIEADETFASSKPDVIDTVTDPHSIQMRVKYNITEILSTPGYMPRLYDDRVGFWEDPHIGFGDDSKRDNHLWYILRWDVEASDPTQHLSPAKKPIVFTLDDSIPVEYRPPVRAAILEWNKAFERIGVSNAVQVQDVPQDGAYDPDDIRFNVVRWITNAVSDFGAEAQIVWDPRTGEIFRGGVLLDSNLVRRAKYGYQLTVAPNASANEIVPVTPRRSYAPVHTEAEYARGMRNEVNFGLAALDIMYGGDGLYLDSYSRDVLKAVTLHEVGHDFGLSHNFIGHNAYTAGELQSKTFTQASGIASSVMEYSPVNLWPKGMSRGALWQTTLGPYDYHVIHWGYAAIPNASTPSAEVATLSRWASTYTNPKYTFAGDEDGFYDGHAVDPRVAPFMLSDQPINWCRTQLQLTESLVGGLDRHFPRVQSPWEDERVAFLALMTRYNTCASSMMHYIGGEYLSRARVGDPGARAPLTPVPRAQEQQAFSTLDRYMLSDSAWRFSPVTLSRLVYTEYMPFSNFGYDPAPRHDVSIAQLAARMQNAVLGYLFSPLVLQRLDDLPSKSRPGRTMTLSDLFVWTQRGVYGDLQAGKPGTTQVHRNLQRRYARMLGKMAIQPVTGTPYDAQALARYELLALSASIQRNLGRGNLDLQTKAHLEAMQADVKRSLDTRAVVPG
jgi:Met-zincin/Domain of unknown function (DUF5117)